MNAQTARRLIAQTVIISAVSAGAWHFGLQPRIAEARRSADTLEAARAELESVRGSHAAEDPSARIAHATAAAGRLDALSDRAADATVLYDQVGDIAERCAVRVTRIDPRGLISAPKNADGAARAVTGSVTSIELTGTFDRIASFVSTLQAETGLSRITALRLTPAHEPGIGGGADPLEATIEIAMFRLAKPADSPQRGRRSAGETP